MSIDKLLSIRRKQKDIFKLRSAGYNVQLTQQTSTYHIEFMGPQNTAYERGRWIINLYLPDQYPYKSPSVGFLNKIYHPNIDYGSGSVCLDVINQTWTPMYQLVNIFQLFLPQLLTYPNPSSPLNHQAAELYEKNTQDYNKKVREIINKYALNQGFQTAIEKLEEEPKDQAESSFEDGSCSLSDRNSENCDELQYY